MHQHSNVRRHESSPTREDLVPRPLARVPSRILCQWIGSSSRRSTEPRVSTSSVRPMSSRMPSATSARPRRTSSSPRSAVDESAPRRARPWIALLRVMRRVEETRAAHVEHWAQPRVVHEAERVRADAIIREGAARDPNDGDSRREARASRRARGESPRRSSRARARRAHPDRPTGPQAGPPA